MSSVETPTSRQKKLVLDPSTDLRFRGPYTQPSKASLILANTSDQWIVFKIRSTHPDHYLVNPPAAFVPPGTAATVVLQMVPVPEKTALSVYLKEPQKFKVEWRILPGKPELSQTATYLMTSNTGGPVEETKLWCRFDGNPEPSKTYQSGQSPVAQAESQTNGIALKLVCLAILVVLLHAAMAALAYFYYYGDKHTFAQHMEKLLALFSEKYRPTIHNWVPFCCSVVAVITCLTSCLVHLMIYNC